MNFFEAQRLAKQNTKRLVFLFVICLFLISGLTATVVEYMLTDSIRANYRPSHQRVRGQPQVVPPAAYQQNLGSKIWGFTFGAMMLVIGSASFWRMRKLQSGDTIAQMLGGIEASYRSDDLKVKMLTNVVEEMSIAAGIPTPRVYILHEDSSINAFAAGFSLQGSVIGVTQGAVDHLNRDELQGLIGHEISHILNGDMKLNIELAGAIFGLMMVSRFGAEMLNLGRGRYRSSKNKGGGQIHLIGLVIYLFGQVGVFFGRFIQSQISKQREYLADAASAQFTRNPKSLAQVLAKIMHHYGSFLNEKKIMDVSHMFFSQGEKHDFFAKIFGTHPPVENRIMRLLPHLKKEALTEELMKLSGDIGEVSKTEIKAEVETNAAKGKPLAGMMGFVSLQNIESRLKSAPEHLHEFVAHPEKSVRTLRMLMKSGAQQQELSDFEKSLNEFIKTSPHNRMILLQMSLDSIRQMDMSAREGIVSVLKKEALMDQKLSAAEKTVLLMSEDYLLSSGKKGEDTKKFTHQQIEQAIAHVITHVTCLDAKGEPISDQAKQSIHNILLEAYKIPKQHCQIVGLDQLMHDLKVLRSVPLGYKEKFTQVLWRCLQADQNIESEERELARVICMLLRVPVPPVLATA